MIPIAEYAKNIGKATISVADKCRRGNLPGAMKVGRDWFVPADAEYPDLRIRSGKYVGARRKKKMTYKIKAEYLDLWEGGDMPTDPDRIITEEELLRFAQEWDKSIDELKAQLIPQE